MVAEPWSSDPLDPLSAYSGLSIFPRTFGSAPDQSNPYGPEAGIDAIHNHLKSLALQSPSNLLEQAKTILDCSSELLNSETANRKDKKEDGVGKHQQSLQERRPALGRKRARFSLKSDVTTQVAVSLEPILDVNQLKDPQEFFLAYERHENATRELQKQIGSVSTDLKQHNPSTTARKCRPRILGRSVRYKHRYISVISENSENAASCQGTFESGILSPINGISQCKTDKNLASQERELTGSMGKPENKFSEILDELLSDSFEDLEGDAAVSILQKRLQIKPIDLEKLSLPDFQDIHKIDLKSSRQNEPKPRNALLDIGNRLKEISSETSAKFIKKSESSIHHIASPTPPRSPFAPLSLLQGQLLKSKQSNDPFSVLGFDTLAARNSTPIDHMHKESDLDDTRMQSSNCGELKSPLIEEGDDATAKTGSHEGAIVDFLYASEALMPKNSSKLSAGVDFGSSGNHLDTLDNVGGNNVENEVIDEQLGGHDAGIDACANGSNKLEDKVEDILQEPVEAVASPQPNVNTVESTEANLNCIQTQLDQSRPLVVEDQAVYGLYGAPDNIQVQHIEEITNMSLNEQIKENVRRPREHKRKELSQRQSLAGAGLLWKSGVRRSTRIRTRPLEYWKGERLLYGRIHKSLATVIGLKYASPTKDGEKPTLKVKSYVSDEYKELVELAALH